MSTGLPRPGRALCSWGGSGAREVRRAGREQVEA